MQVQRTLQIVPVRVIALAFALLAALALAGLAGYVVRGESVVSTTGSVAEPPTLHFKQVTDNMMEREHDRASQLSPILTSPYGVGH